MSEYLIHIGTKNSGRYPRGSGERPYQHDTLKKGTQISNIGVGDDGDYLKKKRDAIYTYKTNDKWDSKVYKGPFSMYKKMTNPYASISWYEHKYKVNRDLSMPTEKQRFEEFVNLYNKHKHITVKDLKRTRKSMINNGIHFTREIDKTVKLNKLRTTNEYKSAYNIFNRSMEEYNSHKSTKKYMKTIRNKYDAMVDDNNKKIYNEAKEPIIIFNPKDVLTSVGNKKISDIEIEKNTNYVNKILNKKGKTVLL